MEKMYHRSEGHASVLKELLDGEGLFAPLLDQSPIVKVRDIDL